MGDQETEQETITTVGDGVSALAEDLTEDEPGDSESDDEVKVRKPALSDTIEPNTYNIKPCLSDKFRVLAVKGIIHDVLSETLGGKVYNVDSVKRWCTDIADTINQRVREMKWKRYKHIVQVIIGEQKGAGVKSGVKCVWDSETDNYATDLFVNESMFCLVSVFAIYFY